MKLKISNEAKDLIAQRKQVMRDLWAGKPVDAIPVDIRYEADRIGTVRAVTVDGDKQLEMAMRNAQETLERLHLTDAIPAMRPDVGCSCIASAFGAEYYWGANEDSTPGVKNYLIPDIEDGIDMLPDPEVTDGWLGEGMKRIARFAEAGEGIIPISLLDTAGGVNVAADLLSTTGLMEAFYIAPEEVKALLHKIQTFLLKVVDASVEAAGGEEYITTTDFVDLWFPEGRKGHISDDMCAMFGPQIYDEFSAPYHSMLYQKYGCGGLHNCGPNPCAERYVAQEFSPRCIDLAYAYSKDDLPFLKQAFRQKAFIYLYWDGVADPVEWYRQVVDIMAGEVLILPSFSFSPKEVDAEDLYRKLHAIYREQAAQMKWGYRD